MLKFCRADRLDYPQATIDTLPDNVLLETFEFYLGKDDADGFYYYDYDSDGWHTLVHVCRRWRCIVFASPRRLDLKLFCTPQRSVNSKTLEIWPELPIVIDVDGSPSQVNATNVIAALRHHNRVCKIYYDNLQHQDSPLLTEFAAIDESFPALTALILIADGQNVPVLPDSFLGGSAPRLRSLTLFGIPYPSIGTLLSSTTNLVRLDLSRIPHSGYIAPETIVPCLSTLARLESLTLHFQFPRSRAHRESRHPPPLTRVVFPSLTSFYFRGDGEYLEDTLSQIEIPVLNRFNICLFNQLVFDTSLLGYFIRRTETFMKTHSARVLCSESAISIRLSEQEDDYRTPVLWLGISCEPLDWQLSALAQVLNSFLSSLPTLESLQIEVTHKDWEGETEVIQWREFLHPFTSVKKLALKSEDLVRLVAHALQELAGERATEVLPALQNLVLDTKDWRPSGPVKEAMEQFITARQLCGHPVTVHYRDRESGEYVQ